MPGIFNPSEKRLAGRDNVDSRYAWYVCIVLSIVNLYNTMDRYSMAVLAEQIKGTFNVKDSQLGFLTGTAFAVFYTLFSYPIARLADRWNRTRLLAIGITIWSSATALSGLASSFYQLAFLRLGLGIGEATVSPTGYSLLAYWFSKPRRAAPMGIFGAGLYLGAGAALLFGGMIVTIWNGARPGSGLMGLRGWQGTFFAFGFPGLFLAIWVFSLREPLRGQSDGIAFSSVDKTPAWRAFVRDLGAIIPPFTFIDAARRGQRALRTNLIAASVTCAGAVLLAKLTSDTMQWSAIGLGVYSAFSAATSLHAEDRPTFALTWGSPTFLLAVVGFSFITTISTIVIIWTGPLASRHLGLDVRTIGTILGLIMALGGAAGTVSGGHLSDLAMRRSPRGRLWVAMVAVVFPLPFTIVMCFTREPTVFFLCFVPVATIGKIWLAGGAATIQDLVLPRMRGTATNVYFLIPTFLGSALGPYIVGKLSELTGELGVGLCAALAVSSAMAVLCLCLCSRGLESTERDKTVAAIAAGERRRSRADTLEVG